MVLTMAMLSPPETSEIRLRREDAVNSHAARRKDPVNYYSLVMNIEPT